MCSAWCRQTDPRHAAATQELPGATAAAQLAPQAARRGARRVAVRQRRADRAAPGGGRAAGTGKGSKGGATVPRRARRRLGCGGPQCPAARCGCNAAVDNDAAAAAGAHRKEQDGGRQPVGRAGLCFGSLQESYYSRGQLNAVATTSKHSFAACVFCMFRICAQAAAVSRRIHSLNASVCKC